MVVEEHVRAGPTDQCAGPLTRFYRPTAGVMGVRSVPDLLLLYQTGSAAIVDAGGSLVCQSSEREGQCGDEIPACA